MADSSNPPTGGPVDPFEPFRAEEIQRERHAREEFEKNHKGKEFALIIGVMKIFRNFLEFFTRQKHRERILEARKAVFVRFRAAIEQLKSEDRSREPKFFDELSSCWDQLLESAYFFPKKSEFANKLSVLITEFRTVHPQGEEYSLGYYLSEHNKGSNWLPLPCIELLGDLYSEHQINPKTSKLNRWGEELDAMIALFSS